jgi:hypothetical protein
MIERLDFDAYILRSIAFDCRRFHVQAALAQWLNKPGQRGKHITLNQDREQQILDRIQQNPAQDTPVTREEIMDYCTAQFKIEFTQGCVNSFGLQYSHDIIPTKSAPQEQQRMKVPRAFPERTIQDLHDYVEGWVAELVFNLDEVGISDYEDRETQKVIAAPRCSIRRYFMEYREM